MAEIIELLPSSPPRPVTSRTSPAPLAASFSGDVFSFNIDDFGSTGEFDVLNDLRSKRRKISTSPKLSPHVSGSRHLDDGIFYLTSEGDVLPDQKDVLVDLLPVQVAEEVMHSDEELPFRFSSSAPEPTLKPSKGLLVFEVSSDDEAEGVSALQSTICPKSPSRPALSQRTANLLAELNTVRNKRDMPKPKGKSRAQRSISVDSTVTSMTRYQRITKPSAIVNDDIVDSSQPELPKKTPGATAEPSVGGSRQKTVSSTASKAEKAAEKEAEKERKRIEKERKAQEKQRAADIAEVNKSKTNKKNSTTEMIVDMPASLQGLSAGNQIEEFMKQLDVQVNFSQDEAVNLSSNTGVSFGNIVRWRRKVVADFDDDLEIWKPLPQARITRENHVLVYLKAEEFVNIAVIGESDLAKSASEIPESTMKANLTSHVKILRTRYPKCTIIYLIEGLSAWNRKSQTLKNRAYTAAVRAQATEEETSASNVPQPAQARRATTAKRKPAKPAIDLSSITADLTEDLLLHLQLHHQPLLIHHTTSAATTAAQITAFTQHLSTRPYRLAEQSHNLASASFCMSVGQIRTGATPHETYINMLQEINRVTPSMAYGISNAGYKNVRQLVSGFKNEGNLMLEDVRKSVNKDGGWSDRRLGPMVSKRLFKVFMGKEPGARDGIA